MSISIGRRLLTFLTGMALILSTLPVEASDQTPPPPTPSPGIPSRTIEPLPVERFETQATTAILPGSALDFARAMDIPAGDIVSVSLGQSDSHGLGIGSSSLGQYPRRNNSFGILSTGYAADADSPNFTSSLSAELEGLNNSQGQDLVRLTLTLRVPNNRSCMSFDFTFFSEEFPEFVGNVFNDTFTAEYGGSATTLVNNEVVTPNNFAYDSRGRQISVNSSSYSLNTGTTYDGTTSLMTARRPVTPGSTITLVFSVQDLGDSIYDSAVFLDNFRWLEQSCSSGSSQLPPVILVHGWQGLNISGDYDCDPDNPANDILHYNMSYLDPPANLEYWLPLADWLVRDGYDVWVARLRTGFNLFGTPSLDWNGRCLANQIQVVHNNNPQPITLVGHSMGGLVIRSALTNNEIRSSVDRMFTFQSPHAGLLPLELLHLGPASSVVHLLQPALANMTASSMIGFNLLHPNHEEVEYTFIGGDHLYNPLGGVYNDGLVSAYSAVGWIATGSFLPPWWPRDSSPLQIFTDELHSRSWGQTPILPRDGAESFSYRCLRAVMRGESLPSVCRVQYSLASASLPSFSTEAENDLASMSHTPVYLGTLWSGGTAEHSLLIDTDAASQFVITWEAGEVEFTLTSPSGKQITPDYAAAHPAEVTYTSLPAGDLPGSASYSFTATESGLWMLHLYSPAADPTVWADYNAYALLESERTLSVSLDQDYYDGGDTALLTARLENADGGLEGGNLYVEIYFSDGTSLYDWLTDLGNGDYQLGFTIPSSPGYFTARLSAIGSDGGVTFERQQDLIGMIRSEQADIFSAYVSPRNTNGDDLSEALDLFVNLTVTEPANLSVIAELSADGTLIDQASSSLELLAGNNQVVLSFSGDEIRRSEIDGPYQISRISLIDVETGIPIQVIEDAFATEPYEWDAFGGCYSLNINPIPSFGGYIDTDPLPNCEFGTQYSAGTEVTLTAIPSSNFEFINWLMDATGESATVSVVMDGEKSVAANFIPTDGGIPSYLSISAGDYFETVDGKTTIQLIAVLSDQYGNRIEGKEISFSVSAGTLSSPTAVTDMDGIATVTFTPPLQLGDIEAYVTSGALAFGTFIHLNESSPDIVKVQASEPSIPADGSSKTVISIQVTDFEGKSTPNLPFFFETNLGSFIATSTDLDENGEATIELVASEQAGTARVTVFTQTGIGHVEVNFLPGGAAALDVTAADAKLPADGASQTLIAVTVRDHFGNPVSDEVAYFSTDLGQIQPFQVQLDSTGRATATLTSSLEPGIATVTVTIGGLVREIQIEFVRLDMEEETIFLPMLIG